MVYITMDEWQSRAILKEGQIEWLWKHQTALERWMAQKRMPEIDRENIRNDIYNMQNPHLAFFFYLYCFQEQTLNDEKKLALIMRKFLGMSSTDTIPKKGNIILIMGQRGSGKTAFAYSICDELNRKYHQEIWWYGPPCILPPFIKGHTLDMNKIPQGAIVLFDEAGVQSYARNTMKTEQVQETQRIPLIRQHDKSFIVITQDEALLDRNWLIQSTCMIFLSKTFIPVRKRRLVINEYLTYFMPQKQGEALYFDNNSIFTLRFKLPTWWNNKYSKPYAPFQSQTEMFRTFIEILKDESDIYEIMHQLSLRNGNIGEYQAEYIKRISNSIGINKLLNYSDARLNEILVKGFYDTPINDLIEKTNSHLRCNFHLRELEKLEWNKAFEKNPELQVTSMINANYILLNELRQASKGKNIICSIYGITGSGKSLASLSLSLCIEKIFKSRFLADHICFEDDQINNALKSAKKGHTIIRDEQEKSFGPGSGAMSEKVRAYERIMRKKQINFIFNSPRLVHHEHHFILKTFGEDKKNEIFRLMMYTPSEMPVGYITLRYPPADLIEEYLKKNHEWLNKKQQDKPTDSKDDIITELETDQLFAACSTKIERETYVRRKYNLTINGAWEIISMYNIKQKEKELRINKVIQ